MGVTGLSRGGMMYQKLVFVARGIHKRHVEGTAVDGCEAYIAAHAMAELITTTCGGSGNDITETLVDIAQGITRDSTGPASGTCLACGGTGSLSNMECCDSCGGGGKVPSK